MNFWTNSRAARPSPRCSIDRSRVKHGRLQRGAVFSPSAAARAALIFLSVLSLPPRIRAQEVPAPAAQKQPEPAPLPKPQPIPHRFWDRKNAALFAGVAGTRALDYASTRHLRNKGLNEILLTNDIVDNRPLFVAIEASGVALSIGVSYIFHKTGHHKLERWVSIVHISVGTGGSIRNYALKPNQPAPSP